MSFGIINHNVSAINGQRLLNVTNGRLNKNLEALSSGMRINRASDDAAGLAVSEKMRTQIGGLDQAERNAQDGISMLQVAEGVLDTSTATLQRMRTLAIQAANDTYTTYDRQQLQKEVDELISEIDRIARYTEFNTKRILNGDGLGTAATSDRQVGSVDVVGRVASAEYSVTILSAGAACNIHGNANIEDGIDIDNVINLRDVGVIGDEELHIMVDGQTRVINVNEEDTLEDVKAKINRSNVGVIAGLDAQGNDLTMTSVRSGARFNVSFGNDPDGVAVKLGLRGGNVRTLTTIEDAVDSTGQTLGRALFTSGTDTVISITNITPQSMFPTDPGTSTLAGGYGQSLGIFRSSSDIFTEKELTNPINGMSINATTSVPGWSALGAVDLPRSQLLKGLVIRIDEDIDFGVLQRTSTMTLAERGWVGYFPDPYSGQGDPNRYDQADSTAAVPNARPLTLPSAVRPTAGTPEAYQEASITSFKLVVRDNRQRFHIGANEGQTVIAEFGNMTSEALGLTTGLRARGYNHDGESLWETGRVTDNYAMNVSVETQDSAERAIGIFDSALKSVSQERAKYGAYQNSLEKRAQYLGIAYENQVAAESRIRDVDMAKEVADFTRNQILIQSGTAMLSQANIKPQSVLSLLG